MTDDELSEKLKHEEQAAQDRIAELFLKIENVKQLWFEYRDMQITLAGRKVCPKCDGFGRLEKLDSGYMRKFGMREWNGCEECGGHHEMVGRGFVK